MRSLRAHKPEAICPLPIIKSYYFETLLSFFKPFLTTTNDMTFISGLFRVVAWGTGIISGVVAVITASTPYALAAQLAWAARAALWENRVQQSANRVNAAVAHQPYQQREAEQRAAERMGKLEVKQKSRSRGVRRRGR